MAVNSQLMHGLSLVPLLGLLIRILFHFHEHPVEVTSHNREEVGQRLTEEGGGVDGLGENPTQSS